MKSTIGKLAAITMGPLMALALYSGIARSQQKCAIQSSQDAFFYKSQITIIKGTGEKTDTLIFTGKLVNEDPTVECFPGLDPTNGCSGATEAGDDFIESGAKINILGFALNDNVACNLAPPNNFFQFTIPTGFTKVNDNMATYSGPATAVDNKSINTSATVDATVWRVGPSNGAPNYNYTDGTCGTFRFRIQVTDIDLQDISPTLVSNPLTWNVNFGDNSFGCFPTSDAKICSASSTKSGKPLDSTGGGCSSGD